MKLNFLDPILLICAGVLLIGIVFLFWAVGKLRKKGAPGTNDAGTGEEDTPLSREDLGLDSPEDRALSDLEPLGERTIPSSAKIEYKESRTSPPAGSASVAATKEVTDRLEAMTQRLSEMQALLNKQASAAPAAGAAPIGQGFSPETIDKLLKIISNVIQQVDVLQKAMNVTKEPAGIASAAPTPSLPKPPVAPVIPPAPAPTTAAPKSAPTFPPVGGPPKP